MITFWTPTELDLRSITVMGLHAKLTDNAIGYFGTGLKYALAVLMRSNHRVTIETGGETYQIGYKWDRFRDKEVQLLYLNDRELPFTSELGKNWKVWQAYRELYSNTMDEGGEVIEGPSTRPGTCITVEGHEFMQSHFERHHFILNSEPLFKTPAVELHPTMTTGLRIFYRGILVFNDPSAQGLFTYNLTTPTPLTEDRTLAHPWSLHRIISQALLHEAIPEREVCTAMAADEDKWEGKLDWRAAGTTLVNPQLGWARNIIRRMGPRANQSLVELVQRSLTADELEPDTVIPTEAEEQELQAAVAILRRHGYTIKREDIHLAPSLSSGALGCVFNKKIFIARTTLDQGLRRTISTLLEEHLHLDHEIPDFSRQMQDHLLDKLAQMMEDA